MNLAMGRGRGSRELIECHAKSESTFSCRLRRGPAGRDSSDLPALADQMLTSLRSRSISQYAIPRGNLCRAMTQACCETATAHVAELGGMLTSTGCTADRKQGCESQIPRTKKKFLRHRAILLFKDNISMSPRRHRAHFRLRVGGGGRV